MRLEDDPNIYILDCIMPLESDEHDLDVSNFAIDCDVDFVDSSNKKRKGVGGLVERAVKVGSKWWKRKYDLTCRYQTKWAPKALWSEDILKKDRLLHLAKCTIYSIVGRKMFVMAPKWNILNFHGLRKCHVKNYVLFAARRPTSVMDQI